MPAPEKQLAWLFKFDLACGHGQGHGRLLAPTQLQLLGAHAVAVCWRPAGGSLLAPCAGAHEVADPGRRGDM